MRRVILSGFLVLFSFSASNLYAQDALSPKGQTVSSFLIETNDIANGTFTEEQSNFRSRAFSRKHIFSGPMILTGIRSQTGWLCSANSFMLQNAKLKLKENGKAIFNLFGKDSGVPNLKGKYKISSNGRMLASKSKTKKFFVGEFLRQFKANVKASKRKAVIKLKYSIFSEGSAVCQFDFQGNFEKRS